MRLFAAETDTAWRTTPGLLRSFVVHAPTAEAAEDAVKAQPGLARASVRVTPIDREFAAEMMGNGSLELFI